MPSSAWAACAVTNPESTTLGSYSPAALANNTQPYTDVPAGLDCPDTVLSLLTGNYLRATVTSTDGFTLTSTDPKNTATAQYIVAADSAGSRPFTAGTPFVYMNGGVINLLGLLGGTARNVQVHAHPSSTGEIPPGTYTGSFKIAWEWRFCDLIAALGLCIGTLDKNPSTIPSATVAVTMTVIPKTVGVRITTRTTWDPLSTTGNPRAIPGSKQRSTITLSNVNVVGIDANTLNLVLPTPAGSRVALDGDGTAVTGYVATAEGSPASTLSVVYQTPASQDDDVDFSADGGVNWTYDPTTTPKAVTNVRIRPRGTMAAGSSFSVSIPYTVLSGP